MEVGRVSSSLVRTLFRVSSALACRSPLSFPKVNRFSPFVLAILNKEIAVHLGVREEALMHVHMAVR
jgi:hypothetical protein